MEAFCASEAVREGYWEAAKRDQRLFGPVGKSQPKLSHAEGSLMRTALKIKVC